MFDLKFPSSVLDEMPVGTSFRDSDHVVTRKDEGWECDDCSSPTIKDSSRFCMSDPSEKYALEKFAGAETDPDNLDPRLLAFLPAGTMVADRDTQGNNLWHWYKTKTGRWLWAHNREEAETSASGGMGIDDLDGYDHLRPFRLFSLGTDEAETEETPESKTVFSAAEATNFKDCRFRDCHNDVWLFDEETDLWRFIRSDGTLSCLFQYAELTPSLEPFILVEGEIEAEAEAETETETAAQELSAEQADEKRDFVLSDSDDDKWTHSGGQWHCEGYEHLTGTHLPDMFEPYEVVEPLAPEPEIEPAVGTKLSAKKASNHKDTVFEDCDGDAWFFDCGLQRWRGIGPDWAYSKEELEATFGPYTSVGPLSEHERGLTAGEANELKDEALEDRDGDIWIFDVPSDQWKCGSAAITSSDLDAYYQPFRIKKADPSTAIPEAVILGDYDPLKTAGGTEEVTFEGSTKEMVELLDRIARSLESISRKLGDK